MSNFPEIAVGTYEEFILGYKPVTSDKGSLELSQSFATHSHQASIRCVAAHGKYLVSSGADEYINIYDLLIKEVVTVINFHSSTVTCLEFVPDGSHLVTANQNGDIAIFTSNTWNLVKHWKEAHKSANGVISISVHPSGALLMSAGADNILRFWNLIKGRQAYAVNLNKKCSVGNSLNFAKWSKSGNHFVVCIGKQAEVYNTDSAAVTYAIDCKARITSADFSDSDLLVIGLDTGSIEIHKHVKKKIVCQNQSHKNRVKCLTTFAVLNRESAGNKPVNYLITGDSSGTIKVWRLRFKDSVYSLLLKGEVNADCRITCLTVVQQEVKEEVMDDDGNENDSS